MLRPADPKNGQPKHYPGKTLPRIYSGSPLSPSMTHGSQQSGMQTKIKIMNTIKPF